MEDSGAQCVGRMSPVTWPLLHVDCWDLVLKVNTVTHVGENSHTLAYMAVAFVLSTSHSFSPISFSLSHPCLFSFLYPFLLLIFLLLILFPFLSLGAYSLNNALFGSGSTLTFGLVLVKQCGNQTLPCTLVVNGTRSQCSHWDDLSLLCTPPGEREGERGGGGSVHLQGRGREQMRGRERGVEGAVCTPR